MDHDFEKVKKADEKTRDLINGYIRECQRLFPQNVTYLIIPSLVNILCTLYYFYPDQWDSDHGIPPAMELNNRTITCIKSVHCSAFMKTICEKGEYHWKH